MHAQIWAWRRVLSLLRSLCPLGVRINSLISDSHKMSLKSAALERISIYSLNQMARAIYDKTASKNWPNSEQNGKSPPIDSLLEWCAHAYMPIYGQRRGGEARVGWFVLQSATLRHFEFEFRRGKTCTELRKGLLNCSVVQILTNRYVLQCPN